MRSGPALVGILIAVLAVDAGTHEGARPWTVEIVVNRWSTDGEREGLQSLVMAGAAKALLHELEAAPPVGRLRTPFGACDLRFARVTRDRDTGRERVEAVTGRCARSEPAAAGGRSPRDWLASIDLRVNEDGDGDGVMRLVSQLSGDFDAQQSFFEHLIRVDRLDRP